MPVTPSGRIYTGLIIPQEAWEAAERMAAENGLEMHYMAVQIFMEGLAHHRTCGKPRREIRRTKR